MISDPPSAFVCDWAPRVFTRLPGPAHALDLAMGRGRHALVLARIGFHVFGVDHALDAVRDAVAKASANGLTLRAWCADFERYPLPSNRFDLVVVTRYLQRGLLPAIGAATRPGGFVIYETFTVHQRAHATGPRSPDHLLEIGELRESFANFDIVFDEEVSSPEAVARLVARKPSGSESPA